MNEKIYALMPEESELVERLNLIYQSNANLVAILSRELRDAACPDTKAMLEDACAECKRSFAELRIAQDAVLDRYFEGPRAEEIRFAFDFRTQEVRVEW